MRTFIKNNNNLRVNVESANNQLELINEIATADLYVPSNNLWPHQQQQHNNHYDTNSDNSSDFDIPIAEYLPEEFDDEPNSCEEPKRSASLSSNTSISERMAEVTIQNPPVVYAYPSGDQLVYSESAQHFQTNVENVMQETQVPFIDSSTNMSHQTRQYDDMQQSIPNNIPVETQTSEFYPLIQNYTNQNNHPPLGAPGMHVTQQQQQELLDLDLNYFYPPVDPYPTAHVHNDALTNNGPTNLCHYEPMPVLQNDLNSPPNQTSMPLATDRHRTQSMSSCNISFAPIRHLSLTQSKSVPNVSYLNNKRLPKKRACSGGIKPKPPNAKQKREMLENDRLCLEYSNEGLKNQVLYLESEISKIKDFCRKNGWRVPDYSEYGLESQ